MKTYRMSAVFTCVLSLLFLAGCVTTGAGVRARPTAAEEEKPIEFVFPEYTGTGEKPKIAVFDFSNDTPFESAVIGAGVANTLVSALVKSKHYIVLERTMLHKIIKEQSLGMTGAMDAATASEVGKLLGVDYMIAGSITEFGIKTTRTGIGFGKEVDASVSVSKGTARVVLDIRIIDPNTAAIVASETGVGTHFSTNLGLAFEEISLLAGIVGFDQTLIGKATRKAVFDIVNRFITTGF